MVMIARKEVEKREAELWERYQTTRNDRIREELVLQYMPLVKYVIGRQLSQLPDHLPREDLLNAGVVGLIEAVERFDPGYNVKFKTYAIPRIKGSILDEIRSYDIVPRSVRLKIRELKETIAELEKELCRTPGEEEIAGRMGISINKYRNLLKKLSPIRFLSLSQTLNNNTEWELPSKKLDQADLRENEELKETLVQAIQELEKSERLMISLYYYEKMTMKEIGMVMDLSESRVSQIHTQAILKLRTRISRYLNA